MRAFLLFLNLLLAGGLVWSAVSLFEPETQSVAEKKKPEAPPQAAKPPPALRTLPPDQAQELVVRNNIFDPARNPAGATGGRSAQLSLTLVGTSDLGGMRGAVIIQKEQRRQQGPPGMPNFNQNPNQNQNRQAQANLQQFVRLGETLPNGYTLTEVGQDYVVLTRSGARTELRIQEASKNQPTTTTAQPQNQRAQAMQQFQQFQQMQMQQQMNMMNMMRQMQQQQQQNQRGNQRGGNVAGGQVVGGATRRSSTSSGGLNL